MAGKLPAFATFRQPTPLKPGMITIVHQNDLVILAGKVGVWRVLTQVNGIRADICRNDAPDTRVITTPLTRLTIVHRAGSPGYSY
jgi:hypothetical protein